MFSFNTGKFISGGEERDIQTMLDTKYDVILLDPPWNYYGSKTKNAAAGKHYNLMPDEDIAAIPVKSLLSKDGIVFVWYTQSTDDRCIDMIKAWGLYNRGYQFVWNKTRLDGAPLGACGVRPSIIKPTVELVRAATLSKTKAPRVHDLTICQQVYAPRGKHSEKPPMIQECIERMYPSASRLELFSRKPRSGWDAWGNEV